VLFGSVLLPSCSPGQETAVSLAEAVEVKYDTAAVTRRNLVSRYQYESYVKAVIEEVSYEKRSGILKKFYVNVGDIVKKGDPIVELDISALEEQIDMARSNLSYRKKKFEYDLEQKQYDIELAEIDLKALVSAGAKESEIELAEINIEKLKTELKYISKTGELDIKKAEDNLKELESSINGSIATAPCDGEVVSLAQLSPGDRVSAYMPLAHIADNSRLYIQYDGSDSIYKGIRYTALIDGVEYDLEAVVYDPQEYLTLVLSGRKPPARYTFVNTPDSADAGAFAALISYAREAENVLAVPVNSLYYSGSVNYVYRMVNGEKVYTEVTCGIRTDSYVEIKSGLEEGDEVFVKQ
jgi:multidrug efflux pump subunit AcrA (membrane-fusion protein)